MPFCGPAGAVAARRSRKASSPPWPMCPPVLPWARWLAQVDRQQLADRALVDYLVAVERQRRHLDGELAAGIAALARRPTFSLCAESDEDGNELCGRSLHGPEGHDPLAAVADELSPAMSWTTGHAQARVELAVHLSQRLPETLAALRSGRIDEYKARVIRDYTQSLADKPDARATVEHVALRVSGSKTAPQLREFVKRQVAAADPASPEQRREVAQAGRHVTPPIPEADDGMASMGLYGPTEALAAFYTAIDAAARARRDAAAKGPQHPDAGKSLGQLRFDVVSDLAFGGLNAGHLGCCRSDCAGVGQRLGAQQGVHAHITVRMSTTTAAGLDELPAELEGYGPIPASIARRLAADATWRRLLTDPVTGRLLDYGRTTYAPPQALREFLIERDVTCRMPTCTWPARSCDLDHEPAWNDGGRTSADGMNALHRRHHVAKTHHGCRIERDADDRLWWVSATGHAYPIRPEVIDPLVAYAGRDERPRGRRELGRAEEPGPPGGADPPPAEPPV